MVLIRLSLIALVVSSQEFAGVDKVLEDAVQSQVFPGCVAAVFNRSGFMYFKPHGKLTYDEKAPRFKADVFLT
jgi:hypothetical protein